jgi:hypothetical protein
LHNNDSSPFGSKGSYWRLAFSCSFQVSLNYSSRFPLDIFHHNNSYPQFQASLYAFQILVAAKIAWRSIIVVKDPAKFIISATIAEDTKDEHMFGNAGLERSDHNTT